jgi:hypothetical protein
MRKTSGQFLLYRRVDQGEERGGEEGKRGRGGVASTFNDGFPPCG